MSCYSRDVRVLTWRPEGQTDKKRKTKKVGGGRKTAKARLYSVVTYIRRFLALKYWALCNLQRGDRGSPRTPKDTLHLSIQGCQRSSTLWHSHTIFDRGWKEM